MASLHDYGYLNVSQLICTTLALIALEVKGLLACFQDRGNMDDPALVFINWNRLWEIFLCCSRNKILLYISTKARILLKHKEISERDTKEVQTKELSHVLLCSNLLTIGVSEGIENEVFWSRELSHVTTNTKFQMQEVLGITCSVSHKAYQPSGGTVESKPHSQVTT